MVFELAFQYDLFEPLPSEMDLIKEELKVTRERSENVRRGLFQRHNAMAKEINEQNDKLDKLRAEIARLKILINNK